MGDGFVLDITSCFTISGRTGRWTVVGGDIVAGTVRTGDELELIRRSACARTRCLGVQIGHGRDVDGRRVPFFGVMLEGIERFEVSSGDQLRGVADHAP